MQKLDAVLRENPYPGRGIVLGVTPGGDAVMAYFIMGRSQNSRNRVLVQRGDEIFTRVADPALLENPELILYTAMRKAGPCSIVANGDQADTIVEGIAAGLDFEAALRTRSFEPDAPHYTPRISGMMARAAEGFYYKLSILKTAEGNPAGTQRFFYEYAVALPGQGHFIHTYQADATPLPSFAGEPVCVDVPEDVWAFGDAAWDAMHPENKIALCVRRIFAAGGEETRLYNRFAAVE